VPEPTRPWWRRPRLWEVGVVALFTTWVAWPFLTTHGWVTGYDAVPYGGPNLAYTLRELEAGRLPAWNQDIFVGCPIWPTPGGGPLPPEVAVHRTDAARAYELITAIHLFWMAGGMLVLLSLRCDLRPPAGAVGAITSRRLGLVMARSLQFEQLAVLAWVPGCWLRSTPSSRPPGLVDRARP